MRRIGKLETPTQVRCEMVHVYKQMYAGKIKPADGSKYIYTLNTILGAVAVEQGVVAGDGTLTIKWER